MAVNIDLEVIVANAITLTAPAEPGLTWAAQVWMFENTFLVEHVNPYQAVAMVVRELKENNLYKATGEDELELYATHLVAEEILEDEEREREEEERRQEEEADRQKQESLREQASFYSDQFRPGEAGYCDPKNAHWEEVDNYPLDKLLFEEIPTREGWIAWMDNEIDMFIKDGMDEIAEMYRNMITDEIEDHIILLERNGKAYIWDGNHRTGAAFSSGKTTIKAIVGKPISKSFQGT